MERFIEWLFGWRRSFCQLKRKTVEQQATLDKLVDDFEALKLMHGIRVQAFQDQITTWKEAYADSGRRIEELESQLAAKDPAP